MFVDISADSSIINAQMASQVVLSSQSVEVLTIESFIRGYHAYMDIWTLVLGEILWTEKLLLL